MIEKYIYYYINFILNKKISYSDIILYIYKLLLYI